MEVRGWRWGLEVCQTPSTGIRHPSFKVEEGAGKLVFGVWSWCSCCPSSKHVRTNLLECKGTVGDGGGMWRWGEGGARDL